MDWSKKPIVGKYNGIHRAQLNRIGCLTWGFSKNGGQREVITQDFRFAYALKAEQMAFHIFEEIAFEISLNLAK